MKVLLINPPYPFDEFPTPPFGLVSLGGYLLEQGIDVKIEDYIVTPYSKERVKRILAEYSPDVVGATGVTMNINTSLRIMRDYKEIDPDIIAVMGGPHVTFDAENILLKNNSIDCVVRGEGEITFVEFLRELSMGRSPKYVAGTSCRENGRVIHNEDRPFIEDINILPYPARHLVQLSKYKAMGLPVNMITSRGCPYKCIFCVGRKMIGKKIRNFDVKRVVDEFELISRMGFNQINIVDDLFTANKKRCIAICDEIINRGISHKWNAFSRVDTVSKELLEKLKEAGCATLCFGIESGNQEILDTIKKRTTLEKCRKAVALCNACGIEPMASYILGLPGETRETVEKTLKFAEQLCTNYGFHILAPFPGTEVREKCEAYGVKILTDDWDKYDANRSVCETGFISHKEIEAIVAEFNSKATKYVSEVLEKREKGDPLSDNDKEFIENLCSFAFPMDLILAQLIETYPGLHNGTDAEAIKEDLSLYIETKSKYAVEEVRKRVSKLFDLNCLKIDNVQGNKTVVWV
jgi:anaerobic magnesium-protoporphyrin IX monomethyl ester cyclase